MTCVVSTVTDPSTITVPTHSPFFAAARTAESAAFAADRRSRCRTQRQAPMTALEHSAGERRCHQTMHMANAISGNSAGATRFVRSHPILRCQRVCSVFRARIMGAVSK